MFVSTSIHRYRTAVEHCVLAIEQLEWPLEFWRVAAVLRSDRHAFLLDTARELPGRPGFSFAGCAPSQVLRARLCGALAPLGHAELEWQRFEVDDPGAAPREARYRGDLFEALRQALAEIALPGELRHALPLPFVGGAVGYVGYDVARFIERLPQQAERDVDVPELCLMFVDQLLVYDHRAAQTHLVTTGRGSSEAEAHARADRMRAALRARLERAIDADRRASVHHSDTAGPAAISVKHGRASESVAARAASGLRSHASACDYAHTVERAREHILAGDAFEVCTTHRLAGAYRGDAWALYEKLRAINPAPFACYLQLPEVQLLSSSPERFLRLSRAGAVEARPIKGTRPRGATPEQDERLRLELANSIKDRAENVMIVDLMRNDLGRVCEVDSIHVPELMVVEDHPSVFQLISTVCGQLSTEQHPVALLRACFPPGSMTGAPKIEAMKIIDALEPYRRGIYSGCVGYFDAGGAMDWSVVIRSFVLQAGRCFVGTGGAVVADSDAAAEYAESMTKAEALLRAFDAAQHAQAQHEHE